MSRSFCSSEPGVISALGASAVVRADNVDPEIEVDGWRRTVDMRDQTIEDLRTQLAEAREEAERGWARVRLLERRIDDAARAIGR